MPDIPLPPPLTHTTGPSPSPVSQAEPPAPEREQALRAAAQSLESSFLAVMLEAAGFGAARESFGGGAGEEQFSSFLVEAHAEALVRRGGIGLAQTLFEALKERSHGTT